MATESTTNIPLDQLIFYAIDKASPYALAQNDKTNTLEKLMPYQLAGLAITDTGQGIMWLWINAHSAPFGAKPVGADAIQDIETVADVRNAVYDTLPAASAKAATKVGAK